MTSTQRKAAYAALVTINAALAAAMAQGLVPPAWSSGVHVASLLLAMVMKEFGASDAPAADPKPPVAS